MPKLELRSQLITKASKLWRGEIKCSPRSQPLINRVKEGKPIRILGPCAVQTEIQMLAIASELARYIDVLRAPDKKPRTRPVDEKGNLLFDGIGHKLAIPIYQALIENYPELVIAVEAMGPEDISALTGLIGLAWSGSRTQEKDTLQELGSAAAQAEVPMMIKNPLSPDPEFFLGMMENWILGAGYAIPFMACIRGTTPCTNSDREQWRNVPNLDWIESLRRAFPDLPIIVDPSHMVRYPKNGAEETGKEKKRRLTTIINLIKQARDKGASGYMVEVHHPDHPSLTDPGEKLSDLLDKLIQHGLI